MTKRQTKKIHWPHQWWLLAAGVAASALFFAAGMLTPQAPLEPARLTDKNQLVDAWLRHCLDQPYQHACWRDAIDRAVRRTDAEKVLHWLQSDVEALPELRAFCHPATHLVGQSEYRQALAISTSFASAPTMGNLCSSGFYHGVLEAAVADLPDGELEATLPTLCQDFDQEDGGHARYNCIHGLGHGLVGYHLDNWQAAVEDCRLMSTDWQQRSCVSGVLMQNLVNRDSNLGHTADFRADDPFYPCSIVDEQWKQSCYMVQPGYWLSLYPTIEEFSDVCRQAVPHDEDCFIGLGNHMSGWHYGVYQPIIDACLKAGSGASACMYGAAQDHVYHYGGRAEADILCQTAPPELQPPCNKGIDFLLASFAISNL